MIIFYKNYRRTDRTLLSIKSVRHLFPNIDIRCLCLYDNSIAEYTNDISLFESLGVRLCFDKKQYNFGHDSAAGSTYNGFYFTEGINKIQALTREEEKVLILDEDSFFTTGQTIQFLIENEFDLAYGTWPAPPQETSVKYGGRPSVELNGSVVGINSKKLNTLFPLDAYNQSIEILLGYELYERTLLINDTKVFQIPTRNYIDYCGDGIHTNSTEEIKSELKKANIPYE